jgi:DNA-binding CsgD family transcriptional regulator
MGRLGDAIADAQTSLQVGQMGAETFMPAARAALALAHVERGEVDAAAAAIDIDDERWGSRIDFALLMPIARARVALARGEAAAALVQLDASAAFMGVLGFRGPVPPDWRIWRTVALLQLGRRDEARETAAEALGIAREWGARWTLGVALRNAGLAEGGVLGLTNMEEAVAILRAGPAALELARTEVELGAAMRRLGRTVAAREVLTKAGDLAHRLGAAALATRARDELVAAGARPRRIAVTGVGALTPSERRVVDLAAEGRTNRQIAESLFVTPKAVEFHLANAFPKLGIGSRRELAIALADRSA